MKIKNLVREIDISQNVILRLNSMNFVFILKMSLPAYSEKLKGIVNLKDVCQTDKLKHIQVIGHGSKRSNIRS